MRNCVRRPAHIVAPEQSGDERKKLPPLRHSAIKKLTPCREDRLVAIGSPQQTADPPSISERGERGFRAGCPLSVGSDPLHRGGKFLRRNFRVVHPSRLSRFIIHFIARGLAPALDPAPAKVTFTVENQKWFACIHGTPLILGIRRRATSSKASLANSSEGRASIATLDSRGNAP